MNLNQYLSEEFKGYIRSSSTKEPVSYYVNPTPSEMIEVAQEEHDFNMYSLEGRARRNGTIRFIADLGKKKLYIFSASCLHYEMGAELNYPKQCFTREGDAPNSIFSGEASFNKEERKLDFLYSDTLSFRNPEFISGMAKLDWSFADKYFTKPVKKIIAGIKKTDKIYKVSKAPIDKVQ